MSDIKFNIIAEHGNSSCYLLLIFYLKFCHKKVHDYMVSHEYDEKERKDHTSDTYKICMIGEFLNLQSISAINVLLEMMDYKTEESNIDMTMEDSKGLTIIIYIVRQKLENALRMSYDYYSSIFYSNYDDSDDSSTMVNLGYVSKIIHLHS